MNRFIFAAAASCTLALASGASAATVSFYNEGVDDEGASTGERFDVSCYSDAALTTMAACSGALIDVGLNTFDTNSLNGLVGDMTDNGNGVTPADELLDVQDYVGDPTLTYTSGIVATSSGGGSSDFVIENSIAEYFTFTVGQQPRFAILRNDSGSALWLDFEQVGQGAGLSHYGEIGMVNPIPLPAAGWLLLGGLGGLAAMKRRKS